MCSWMDRRREWALPPLRARPAAPHPGTGRPTAAAQPSPASTDPQVHPEQSCMHHRLPARRPQPRMLCCQPLSTLSHEQTCAGLADIGKKRWSADCNWVLFFESVVDLTDSNLHQTHHFNHLCPVCRLQLHRLSVQWLVHKQPARQGACHSGQRRTARLQSQFLTVPQRCCTDHHPPTLLVSAKSEQRAQPSSHSKQL